MAPTRILALTPDDLTKELGKIVINAQNEALADGRFDIGISGGSQIPALAAALLNNSEVKWGAWRVWLVDERITPSDDPNSNFGAFKKEVYDKIPGDAKPQCFHSSEDLLKKNADHKEFAADYQKQLLSGSGARPALNLASLGMGPDGHTCSLFPGSPLLKEDELFVASLDDSPKPPPGRITLTKRALALAHQIVFVATGASKKEAIHKIFTEEDSALPTRQVIDCARNPVIFLTDPAALGQ